MKTVLKLLLLPPIFALFFVFYRLVLKATPSPINSNANQIGQFINVVNYQSKWDSSEMYRITPSLAKSDLVLDFEDVTLVTQCSYQRLFSLLNILDSWQGPVSLAVFAMPAETNDVLFLIALFRHCFDDVRNYVTFHLVTYEGNGNLKYTREPLLDCSMLNNAEQKLKRAQNYNLSVAYPVNVMRNTARREVASKYFFLIDVDMIPNRGLRRDFAQFVRQKQTDGLIFIVPAFELKENEAVPDTKQHIKMYFLRRFLRPFYSELCSKCHSCVDYSSWLHLPDTEGVSAAYEISWHDACEPFYIASSNVPLYDEAFKQYGFNRISQVCELFVAGYTFRVLDNAFLVHLGMKSKEGFHRNKDAEQELNRKKYREFKHNLKFKYPDSERHC